MMNSNFVHELDWPEYLTVALSLLFSVGLSVWFYVQEQQQKIVKSVTDRPILPLLAIVLSLIASATTGVSLLGKPAESYSHGIDAVVFMTASNLMHYCIGYFLFLPVILKLKTDTIYEYFDLRFNASVKKLVSVPYVIVRILNTSLATIPPAVVIHHFSGISETVLTASLMLLTTFYTMIGGFKGVVWTDAFQSIVMILTSIILTFLSVVKVGGIDRIAQIAYQTDRLTVESLSFDPRERISIWAYGTCMSGLSIVILNQSIYQRLKSLSSEKKVKRALGGHIAGLVGFLLASNFVGLAIYAYYYGCDPKAASMVDSYSDVVVYWADEVGQNIKGLRGLYIAGITCAAISTMSTHINTVAEMICVGQPDRRRSPVNLRIATLGVGIAATVAALIMRNTGSLVELSFAFNSLEGISSGLFLLGTLFVSTNAKGALIGGISSLVTFSTIILGSRLSNAGKALKPFGTKIMRTDLCPNSTIVQNHDTDALSPQEDVFFLFQLSPFSLGPMATIMTILVGLCVSRLYPEGGRVMTELDADLFSPIAHRYLIRRSPSRDDGKEKECLEVAGTG